MMRTLVLLKLCIPIINIKTTINIWGTCESFFSDSQISRLTSKLSLLTFIEMMFKIIFENKNYKNDANACVAQTLYSYN